MQMVFGRKLSEEGLIDADERIYVSSPIARVLTPIERARETPGGASNFMIRSTIPAPAWGGGRVCYCVFAFACGFSSCFKMPLSKRYSTPLILQPSGVSSVTLIASFPLLN